MQTSLFIEGVGFPSFSARRCIQELSLLSDPKLFRRTINGELMCLAEPGQEKYMSFISCEDKDVPALSHFVKGQRMKVHCIQNLTVPLSNGIAHLHRPWVEGSILVKDEDGNDQLFEIKDKNIVVQKPGYVSFRPIMTMMLKHFQFKIDEWGLKVGWQLDLEEV